jgi:hypothetical protein
MTKIKIYDGGYSDEQRELDQVEYAKQQQEAQDRATAKQAVLDKLGLTADEVAALLS